MALCGCYKHLFFLQQIRAEVWKEDPWKTLIAVWLDLLFVLVNMLGLFHFHGMEALGKEDPDISYASYEHFGTRKGQNEVCELLDTFLGGAAWSGCAALSTLVLQWGMLFLTLGTESEQKTWPALTQRPLTDCVLCSAGRITGSRGSTGWKSLPVSRTMSAQQPELVLWAVLAACPFPCRLTHPHSALSLSHSTSLLKWHLLLHWIFSLSWIPHSWELPEQQLIRNH